MKLTLGHSPDPDDAFMFCALAQDEVDTEGLEFEHILQDIQTLNERAEREELDVTALSLHAYSFLADKYRLTTCGASVGDGYGPLIVSNRVFIEDELDADTKVYVPGEKTTAFLALKLYAPDAKTEVMEFDKILPAIVEDEIETGLLIHEGQITFANYGIYKIEDLGEWWKLQTGLPLPLGVNAVRRGIDEETQLKIQRVLHRSIDWGLENRDAALSYAKQFGRGIDDWTNDKFVGMYVNRFTLDLGDDGREGVATLLRKGAEIGMLPKDVPVDPIPHQV